MSRVVPALCAVLWATLLLSATSQSAEPSPPAEVDSGLPIGEESPAFDPQHVWGPDKGSHACPMCKYGFIQGVMYWVNSDADWDEVKTIAKFLEEQSATRGKSRFKGYLIYTNPGGSSVREIESKLTALSQDLTLSRIAVTYVPSPTDPKTAALNRINPMARNTLIVYRKRRVFDKFVNFVPTEESLRLLASSVDRAERGGTRP